MNRRLYEADWERRRAYLTRSMFVTNPELSPIPELRESGTPYGLKRDTPASSQEDYSSHLLTVERGQKINKHDESEEFYEGLKKRMLRYYKKIFGLIDDNCSDIENYEFDDNDYSLDDVIEPVQSQTDNADHSMPSSDVPEESMVITFNADVHAEKCKEKIKYKNLLTVEKSISETRIFQYNDEIDVEIISGEENCEENKASEVVTRERAVKNKEIDNKSAVEKSDQTEDSQDTDVEKGSGQNSHSHAEESIDGSNINGEESCGYITNNKQQSDNRSSKNNNKLDQVVTSQDTSMMEESEQENSADDEESLKESVQYSSESGLENEEENDDDRVKDKTKYNQVDQGGGNADTNEDLLTMAEVDIMRSNIRSPAADSMQLDTDYHTSSTSTPSIPQDHSYQVHSVEEADSEQVHVTPLTNAAEVRKKSTELFQQILRISIPDKRSINIADDDNDLASKRVKCYEAISQTDVVQMRSQDTQTNTKDDYNNFASVQTDIVGMRNTETQTESPERLIYVDVGVNCEFEIPQSKGHTGDTAPQNRDLESVYVDVGVNCENTNTDTAEIETQTDATDERTYADIGNQTGDGENQDDETSFGFFSRNKYITFFFL